MTKIGVLLTNTGTPDAPTAKAVRRYLREFLSDKRIVQLPRIVWLPILHGIILPLRPKKSAALYQNIWTPEGSPMRVIMQQLQIKLSEKFSSGVVVELGMNYGNPSIREGLKQLRQHNVDKVIILPLYPQYSDTTTASTQDRVTAALKKCPAQIDLTIIKSYADDGHYIRALAASIQQAWRERGQSEHLLISFHGIPERFVKKGDPYQSQCELTTQLLVKELELPADKWTLCYQSQFGYDKWLKPATKDILTGLAQRGIKQVDVICPGFAVDCLETLEEIAIQYREFFHEVGGESLRYIPALNDSPAQVDLLAALIARHSAGA